jgi:hypothetical protein
MKYFIDTEFREAPCSIELISLGIVAEDGRTLYAENAQLSNDVMLDPWLVDNVIPHLRLNKSAEGELKGLPLDGQPWVNVIGPNVEICGTLEQIGKLVRRFIVDDSPKFWGYYADYDWVVFCWLFGRMIDLPKGWPMYCRDIKQLMDGFIPGREKPEQKGNTHDALADARYHKRLFDWVMAVSGTAAVTYEREK